MLGFARDEACAPTPPAMAAVATITSIPRHVKRPRVSTFRFITPPAPVSCPCPRSALRSTTSRLHPAYDQASVDLERRPVHVRGLVAREPDRGARDIGRKSRATQRDLRDDALAEPGIRPQVLAVELRLDPAG